jgi:hypothetical protein
MVCAADLNIRNAMWPAVKPSRPKPNSVRRWADAISKIDHETTNPTPEREAEKLRAYRPALLE